MIDTSQAEKRIVTRFYNYLSINGDRVIKGAPKDRFIKETEWFREAKNIIPDNIPHIFDFDKQIDSTTSNIDLSYYEMQAIDGQNLYQWSGENKNRANETFDRLISLTKTFHKKSYLPKNDDIYQMYYLKPKTALTSFLKESKIDKDSLVINDQEVSNPLQHLDEVYQNLEARLQKTRYSFIHGDLTMSNTMIDKAGKLYLIDPRGGFGNTNVIGDVRYDVAKLYYSIVGNFDSLNNGRFSYIPGLKRENSHYYSIDDSGFGNLERKIIDGFNEDEELIKYIHSTIWLSLIPHVSNDRNQQLCVFCHAVTLLNNIQKNEK